MEEIDDILSAVTAKDAHVLCREVMSITDTMDVLRAKWNVEILTAILCGQTRFKDMQMTVKGISEKVLSDRLRQLADDKLIEKQECYGYPPRVEYRLTEHGKRLYGIIYQMTEWGVESGDDWTLKRINKGYTSQDILEQCHKLEKAGIQYWMTFLNGVAGREHSHEHAVNSAKIFNQCKPMLVGTGGLTLFPGTPLLEEAERGEFTPLTERELMQELLTFLELLTCDCELNTHHTSSMNLTGPDFLKRKPQILETLRYGIEHFDMDKLTRIRNNKHTL